MRRTLSSWAAAALLLVIGVVNDAGAIPSSNPYRTGYIANVYQEHLLYDSSTDRLSYTGWNRFDYRNVPPCPCDMTVSLNGLFVWDVGVDDHNVTNFTWRPRRTSSERQSSATAGPKGC